MDIGEKILQATLLNIAKIFLRIALVEWKNNSAMKATLELYAKNAIFTAMSGEITTRIPANSVVESVLQFPETYWKS